METIDLRTQVAAFLDRQENPVPRDIAINMVLQFLRDQLVAGGTPYLVDGAPMLLRPDGTLKLLTLENQEVCDFLHAAGLPLSSYWKQMFGDVLMTGNLPVRRLHGISLYLPETHLLFLNEWDGHFLRIDGTGKVTRHINGEYDLLFATGPQPHRTDLAAICTSRALLWQDEDPLVEHVLGVGVFSSSTGLKRHHAINLLLAWMLAVMMKDRVKTVPIPFLNGPSGTRKSSIAKGIGQVISPEGEAFRVTACPSNARDVENIIVNAHGILALDEFQQARELASVLKATTTGADIRRRILFTTSKERTFRVDAVPFLTVNDDIWADEALQKRLLRIAMGQPGPETGGWRGENFVARDWREKGLRAACWNELVSRLAGAMQYLQLAKEKGRDDLVVPHRMSGFFSFLLSIAEQEGSSVLADMQESMAGLDASQKLATEASDDLLETLLVVLRHHPDLRGVWIPVSKIRRALDVQFQISTSHISRGLRELVSSSFQLNRRLASSSAYQTKLGMKIRHRAGIVEYFFDPEIPLGDPTQEDPTQENPTQENPTQEEGARS